MTDDGHISDRDMERFILGMVKDEAELESLEQHLLVCGPCIERAEETRQYVGTMKTALVRRRRPTSRRRGILRRLVNTVDLSPSRIPRFCR